MKYFGIISASKKLLSALVFLLAQQAQAYTPNLSFSREFDDSLSANSQFKSTGINEVDQVIRETLSGNVSVDLSTCPSENPVKGRLSDHSKLLETNEFRAMSDIWEKFYKNVRLQVAWGRIFSKLRSLQDKLPTINTNSYNRHDLTVYPQDRWPPPVVAKFERARNASDLEREIQARLDHNFSILAHLELDLETNDYGLRLAARAIVNKTYQELSKPGIPAEALLPAVSASERFLEYFSSCAHRLGYHATSSRYTGPEYTNRLHRKYAAIDASEIAAAAKIETIALKNKVFDNAIASMLPILRKKIQQQSKSNTGAVNLDTEIQRLFGTGQLAQYAKTHLPSDIARAADTSDLLTYSNPAIISAIFDGKLDEVPYNEIWVKYYLLEIASSIQDECGKHFSKSDVESLKREISTRQVDNTQGGGVVVLSNSVSRLLEILANPREADGEAAVRLAQSDREELIILKEGVKDGILVSTKLTCGSQQLQKFSINLSKYISDVDAPRASAQELLDACRMGRASLNSYCFCVVRRLPQARMTRAERKQLSANFHETFKKIANHPSNGDTLFGCK